MNSLNKTFIPTQNSKSRNWFIIDCKGQRLGRLATTITTILRGKRKPDYHPSVDIGDYIILINANSIRVNEDKKHYLVFNPGRPGHALRIKNVFDCLAKLTIERAVKRMLSETEAKRLMRRLKIYSDQNHIHQAQNPIKMDPNNIYCLVSDFHHRTPDAEPSEYDDDPEDWEDDPEDWEDDPDLPDHPNSDHPESDDPNERKRQSDFFQSLIDLLDKCLPDQEDPEKRDCPLSDVPDAEPSKYDDEDPHDEWNGPEFDYCGPPPQADCEVTVTVPDVDIDIDIYYDIDDPEFESPDA